MGKIPIKITRRYVLYLARHLANNKIFRGPVLSLYVQGQNEDILKIVGRAVLTLHLHGETLSSDKVSSMIACYAEEEPVSDDENQRLYALAIQMLS